MSKEVNRRQFLAGAVGTLAAAKSLGQSRGKPGPRPNVVFILADDLGWGGQKQELYEGGVRVPAIVRWPGVIRPGTASDQPVITMD